VNPNGDSYSYSYPYAYPYTYTYADSYSFPHTLADSKKEPLVSLERRCRDQQCEHQRRRLPLHTGFSSGNYTQSTDLGNTTTVTLPLQQSGATYYFIVTAYNSAGIESPASNQVSAIAP
jgi:hypothetical protein